MTARARIIAGAAALVLAWAAPAAAAYVFYHHVWDDWSATCWFERASGNRFCSLIAPPQSLEGPGASNLLQVDEYASAAFQVVIRVRDEAAPGSSAFLRVDAGPVHETRVEDGLARWTGETADTIVGEMWNGKRLVFRVQTAPEGLPRDTWVSLAGFAEALDVYRRLLRTHRLLPDEG